MNRTEELHPVDALLLIALVVIEAVIVLAAAGVALAGALLPQPPRPQPAPPAPLPAVHPLATIAADVEQALAPATVAQLRRQARATGLPRPLAHRGRRADLIAALVALEVVACS